MLQFKNTRLINVQSLTEYYRQMNEDDRSKLRIVNMESMESSSIYWDHYYEFEDKIGYVTLNLSASRVGSVTVYIKPEYRTSFIRCKASYGLAAILFYAFDYLSLPKIETSVVSYNTESLNLQKKFFIQEGIQRKSILHKGEYFDFLLFGLMKNEFEEKFSHWRDHFSII